MSDFKQAGERLVNVVKQSLLGVVDLDAASQVRLKKIGERIAEVQLLALSDPRKASEEWLVLEVSLKQWKQVALGRTEAARFKLKSAFQEFLTTAGSIAINAIKAAL